MHLVASGSPWWRLLPLLLLFMTGGGDAGLPGPRFVGQIENVTVAAGRNAVLTCTVEHLRGYKVAWVQVETQTILTIHTSVITRNPRVGLSHEGHNVYRLHLKEVTEADRGYYMCQMNTDPMINQKGFLQVVVPPDIDDSAWTGDLVVREGTNVSLECKARGYPPPTVTWRREDPHDPTQHSVKVLEGQTLTIGKVSRLHMGAYLCVASNGIQPSVSKRIQLKVQFPPMLWIPNQLEGARRGESATLQCNTEAFPRSINYWTNHRGEMIAATGTRYETTTKEESYKTYMKLVIHNLTQYDFNTYRCIAKNSLGETDGSIRLYEIEPKRDNEDTKEGSAGNEEGEGGSGDGEGGGGGGPGGGGGGGGEGGRHNSTFLEDYGNLATDKRGRVRNNKQSPSKKTGRGPNSWRTGEAVNEVLTDVDLMFREKEYSHSKDLPSGRNTASSYDHSFSFDAGAGTSPSPIAVLSAVVACVAALRRL
ncbi:neurotrimin-like isoform X2 [Eriocheir sinensis]|uniref:neurotrimin-like isoform X2 n=1 Tax=Eriocheir sinensis TaxID=95602 RepID=UPI0021C6D49F|nr:neurotrimin-like isoform X2 [Eriocheir sinensis]